MSKLIEGLPELYRSLLPEAFAALDVPPESKATCSSCAMAENNARDAVASVDGRSRLFRADAKCCTYQPKLPNYLVGALLSDERPELAEGRRRMRERIAARHAVTPQWVRPTGKFRLMYANARRAFGRSLLLRCPFFDGGSGGCTIWPFREAVCSTYFCRYVAGEDGRTFWTTTKRYLSLVEIQLSRWAVHRISPELLLTLEARGSDDPPLGPEELDEQPPRDDDHRSVWKDWAGREEELYRATHEHVRTLSPVELERICGFDSVVYLAQLARDHDKATRPQLPDTLRFNPSATIKWLPDGSFAVGAYSELEAVALPAQAHTLLLAFDGRESLAATRARMREEWQVDLDDELLLMLYRHRVLTTPNG